jgi:hypothetical protein
VKRQTEEPERMFGGVGQHADLEIGESESDILFGQVEASFARFDGNLGKGKSATFI